MFRDIKIHVFAFYKRSRDKEQPELRANFSQSEYLHREEQQQRLIGAEH